MTELNENVWIDSRLSSITLKGGGGGEQTTVQKADPWSGVQDYLKEGYHRAEDIYMKDAAPGYYPDSTVAPQSDQTKAAINAEFNYGANGSAAGNGANNAVSNLTQGNFLYSDPSMALYGNTYANSQNPALGIAQGQAMFGTPGSGTMGALAHNNESLYSQAALGGIASGSQNLNPYLQSQMDAANANLIHQYQTTTAPQTAAAFENNGRFGSGAYINAMSSADRNLAAGMAASNSNLLGSAYENMANRQLSAANQVQSAINAQNQLRLSAAGNQAQTAQNATSLFGQLGQQGIQNQLAAAQGIGTSYNNAASNQVKAASIAPYLQQMDTRNIAMMNDAGSQIDAYNQAKLNDDIQRYNYYQNLPYQQLNGFMGLVQGGAGLGGTTTSSTPLYHAGSSALGGALGGAASGAAMGSYFGPYGTAIGAVAGGLYGALS